MLVFIVLVFVVFIVLVLMAIVVIVVIVVVVLAGPCLVRRSLVIGNRLDDLTLDDLGLRRFRVGMIRF